MQEPIVIDLGSFVFIGLIVLAIVMGIKAYRSINEK